ncbi:uncharacterized protein LOC114828189 [Galendromus occidentalis]|uniref:Uncharacterized protein LOC114828189 n=1 Tax=Galendromus occidentalis TaxID=34638 RepID=A0AAJ7WHI9_9ACAR|nr:uncharacterized protein LOC114828189 [Galendromus occidentalis]
MCRVVFWWILESRNFTFKSTRSYAEKTPCIHAILVEMKLTPSVLIGLSVIAQHRTVSQDLEYKENNIPDFNFCVYSLEPLRVLVSCFLGRLPGEFATEFTNTVQEAFGGLEVVECLKFICKNNNDDGSMLMVTWIDELEEHHKRAARLAVWDCMDEHRSIVESAA